MKHDATIRPFRLLMLSAMYENGGNMTHRLLDGHPQMFVYPFESQVGSRLVSDALASVFPVKYRWPVFDLDATALQDYRSIIDEECKVRSRTPHVSKFRHIPFDFSDDERCERYQRHVARTGRGRAANMEAFFRSTFEAWKDCRTTGREEVHVGYSPIIAVDADKILRDLPGSHVLHVVRNPWSAYADTKKRPVPLSLASYILGWTLNQHHALLFQRQFPGRMHVIRTEDVLADPVGTLGSVCEKLGLERSDTLRKPTWNGTELAEVYPWGMIRSATPAANRSTALELSPGERDEVRMRAEPYLDVFGYREVAEEFFR
jgi:sulfotransferase family protein